MFRNSNTNLSDSEEFQKLRFSTFKENCSKEKNPVYCIVYKAVNVDSSMKSTINSYTYKENYSLDLVSSVLSKYKSLYESGKIPYYGESTDNNKKVANAIQKELGGVYDITYISVGRIEAILYQVYLGYKYGVIAKEFYRPTKKTVTPSTNNPPIINNSSVKTSENLPQTINNTDEQENSGISTGVKVTIGVVGSLAALYFGNKLYKNLKK